MATDTIAIQPKRATATLIVAAGDGPTLVTNIDLVNTIFIGDTEAIRPTDSTGVVPLGPNASITVNGQSDLFAVNGNTATVTVATITGGLSNFLGLTQGMGNLAIPSIQSPNFNLANPSASPSPSWGILQNGLAYFVGLTLFGGVINGPDYIINTNGIFVYSGTPAHGNLIHSWSFSGAGTDGFSNAYPSGITIGLGTSTQIEITSTAGVGFINFLMNSASFSSAFMRATLGTFAQLLVAGPNNTVAGHTDSVAFELNSSDGTGSANGVLAYNAVGSGSNFPAHWDAGGFSSPVATITAVHPGTGTVATPAVAETPQTITLDAGWSAVGGHPVPQFWVLADNGGGRSIQLTGFAQHVNFAAALALNSANPIPVPYRPATGHYYRSGDSLRAGLELDPNGVITAFPVAAGNTAVDLDGVIALT